MLFQSPLPPWTLRQNVTSPGGTTAAGLAELMDPDHGLPPLMRRTVGDRLGVKASGGIRTPEAAAEELA